MARDQSVIEAEMLWKKGQRQEAMLVLVKRIERLNEQAESLTGMYSEQRDSAAASEKKAQNLEQVGRKWGEAVSALLPPLWLLEYHFYRPAVVSLDSVIVQMRAALTMAEGILSEMHDFRSGRYDFFHQMDEEVGKSK